MKAEGVWKGDVPPLTESEEPRLMLGSLDFKKHVYYTHSYLLCALMLVHVCSKSIHGSNCKFFCLSHLKRL